MLGSRWGFLRDSPTRSMDSNPSHRKIHKVCGLTWEFMCRYWASSVLMPVQCTASLNAHGGHEAAHLGQQGMLTALSQDAKQNKVDSSPEQALQQDFAVLVCGCTKVILVLERCSQSWSTETNNVSKLSKSFQQHPWSTLPYTGVSKTSSNDCSPTFLPCGQSREKKKKKQQ